MVALPRWQTAAGYTLPVHSQLQGINWFGFNNGQTMLDGLWSGYQNATLGDFPTVLKRLKLLGFNGIRMPFTFQDLDRTPNRNLYASDCRVSASHACTKQLLCQLLALHSALAKRLRLWPLHAAKSDTATSKDSVASTQCRKAQSSFGMCQLALALLHW